ncbi:MAG: heavy-metal-associated domain-containing protein [Syntrophomonadaceae bacterium]|jgi:copper chaperone CopZ|nr:heavy-metal-associated domain-containing protein [Syntrophomonadaceae bacterium]
MSISRVEIEVAGMSCNHCVQSVKNALEKITGVKEVEVNLEAGQATVQGEDLLPDNISKTIEELGFIPGKYNTK